MALVTCPDCGTQVSDTAPSCPKCARPLGPAVGNVSHAPVVRKKPFYTRKRFIIPAALLGLIIVMNMASGGGDSESQVQPQSTDASAASAPVASAPQEPETSGLTAAQQNALRSAENYIQMSGFSRQGLIDQLSSDAGEQYSVEDATAAVDRLQVDWSEQAARSAKNYLDMSGFSCKGLIEQLSSSAGDKYTVEQATAGAKSAGAC
ncbi:MAG TPA: Ltp family lipoprotein [Longimicrobium sp.]|jgi:hypothetical protein